MSEPVPPQDYFPKCAYRPEVKKKPKVIRGCSAVGDINFEGMPVCLTHWGVLNAAKIAKEKRKKAKEEAAIKKLQQKAVLANAQAALESWAEKKEIDEFPNQVLEDLKHTCQVRGIKMPDNFVLPAVPLVEIKDFVPASPIAVPPQVQQPVPQPMQDVEYENDPKADPVTTMLDAKNPALAQLSERQFQTGPVSDIPAGSHCAVCQRDFTVGFVACKPNRCNHLYHIPCMKKYAANFNKCKTCEVPF